jgi:hypothetical protein
MANVFGGANCDSRGGMGPVPNETVGVSRLYRPIFQELVALSDAGAADLPRKESPPVAAAPMGKYPVGKYPVGKYPVGKYPQPVVTKG